MRDRAEQTPPLDPTGVKVQNTIDKEKSLQQCFERG